MEQASQECEACSLIRLSQWDAELGHGQRAVGAGINAGATVDAVAIGDHSVLIGHLDCLARAGIHTRFAARALFHIYFHSHSPTPIQRYASRSNGARNRKVPQIRNSDAWCQPPLCEVYDTCSRIDTQRRGDGSLIEPVRERDYAIAGCTPRKRLRTAPVSPGRVHAVLSQYIIRQRTRNGCMLTAGGQEASKASSAPQHVRMNVQEVASSRGLSSPQQEHAAGGHEAQNRGFGD